MRFRSITLLLISFSVFCLLYSFRDLQDSSKSEIGVQGQVFYNFEDPLFNGLKVKCKVVEDGKPYKTFTCDEKGKFRTTLGINHTYMFLFSMDYHGTTKVLISTQLPPEKLKKQIGGLFKFKCEIFERVEGLSMSLLRKPIIKIRYIAAKDKFEPDKKYTERFLWELEDFKETLITLKNTGHKLLRHAPPPQKQLAKKEARVKPKPVIAKAPEKKKNLNPRGHRNILDQLKKEPPKKEDVVENTVDEEEIVESIIAEEEQEEEVIDQSDEIVEERSSELPPTDELQVFPKREKIAKKDIPLITKKMEMREIALSRKSDYNEVVRPNIMVYQLKLEEEKNNQLNNKHIQSLRLQGIIRTVASEKKTELVKRHSEKPILTFEVLPSIEKHIDDGVFVDSETIDIIFPTKKFSYRKEVYWFGLEYYYRNDEEVTFETFCQEINHYDKNMEICTRQ